MTFQIKHIKRRLYQNESVKVIIWLLLALLITFIVMLPNLNNGWVSWDDKGYVLQNKLVHSLTAKNIVTIFKTPEVMGNYHPLTLLSLAADYSIGGQEPGIYHVTNVLWHLANVVLVFWFIYLLCGRVDVAGLTALLFGIHPMHLESVAWISSRKDVLYGFFFLLGLISYLYYLKRDHRSWKHYLLCLVFFMLSLLSKSMAVTFPVVLLAVDFFKERRTEWRRLIIEKIPFFSLSIAFGILAVITQQHGAALEKVREIAFSDSFFVACYGTIVYLIKSLIPFQLSAFHPYPVFAGEPLPWYFFGAALPVLLLLFLCVRFWRQYQTIVFGIAFFVIVIIPVSQLLPVGQAVIAERYTYIAYIGLFFPLAAGVANLKNKKIGTFTRTGRIVYVVFLGYIGLLGVVTFQHSATWKNGKTLWTEVIKKYPSHFFAYGARANYFVEKGDDRALADYSECIRLNPRFYEAYNNRGLLYLENRSYDHALTDFNQSLELKHDFSFGYTNRGLVYFNTKQYVKALADFNQAIIFNPDFAGNYYNRGLTHQRLEKLPFALENFNKAIELEPWVAMFYKDRGFLYGLLSQYDKALTDFSRAIELDPGYAEAYYWRSIGFYDLKQYNRALQDAVQARKLGYYVEEEYIKSLQK